MLSIQHLLCARLQNVNHNNPEYMASVIFPDAIRKYSGARQYSHFEKGSDGVNDTSYWEMPTDMKNVTKESVQRDLEAFGHLSESIRPAAIGELSDINEFYKHNSHLPTTMFHGVEDHLKQDIIFDDFIRDVIDCSRKYEDIYVFKGQEMNGKEARGLIGEIEQHGVYILACEIYEKFGEVTNQEWFESKIKPILYEMYPEDLAETTYSFMKIDPKINELITNKDWSMLNDGPITYKEYVDSYTNVMGSMNKGLNKDELEVATHILDEYPRS